MKKLKKIFAILLIALALTPASSANQIILDRLSSSEEEKLDIEIPSDVKPGFHELIIEIYDESGTIKKTLIDFCKTEDGEIRWDNVCPGLLTSSDYSPSEDAPAVVDSMIVLFALAAAAALATKERKSSSQEEKESDEDREQGDIASADSGKLRIHEREEKWGDQSFTWRAPLTTRVDEVGKRVAPLLFKVSPALARSFVDSSYLRAILGSISLLAYPLAAWIGILAANENELHPVVPTTLMLLALVSIGILDSFAGLVAGLAFFTANFLAGDISNQDQLLTAMGILAITFTPALIASAFRPLRRLVDERGERWERVKDYALVTVLTGWAISKIVAALNGLSGEKLEISNDARLIGLMAGALLVLRLAGEELATYAYPRRLLLATPILPDPNLRQRITTLALKTFILFVVALPFIGISAQLYLGLAIFAIPALLVLLLKERLPEFTIIGRVIPNGALKIVVMIIVGSLFGSYIQSLYSDPEEFLRWSFALLAIPGAALTILGIFAKSPDVDWKENDSGRRVNFVGGFIVYGLILAAISGRDITELLSEPLLAGAILLILALTALSPRVARRT